MFKFDLWENEEVQVLYRQSEAVLIKPAAVIFVLIYLPWYFLLKYELAADYRRLLLAWTIIVLVYGVYKYLLWLLNIYLVTNKRLAVINYPSLVKKRVAESSLHQIANISFVTTGFFASLFGFGNVEATVMGLAEPLVLKNVRQPAKVKDFIWKVHQRVTLPAQVKTQDSVLTARPAAANLPVQKRKIV